MTKIYDQFDAAFRQVGVNAILKGGEHVANVSFKFPKDGAGRLYAYVHIIGMEMVRGYAGGYGYDKKSAAVESAIQKITPESCELIFGSPVHEDVANTRKEFCQALQNIGGAYWNDALRVAGYTVINVM